MNNLEKLDFLNIEIETNYKSLNNVNWTWISIYQSLSEEFIREFKDKLDWEFMSKHQELSENFIREFNDKVDWCYISKYQKLSEEFIREFKDKIDWWNISKYQKLSINFINEFKDKVVWENIHINQNLNNNNMKKEEFKNRQIQVKQHEDDLFEETYNLLSDMLNEMTFDEKQKIHGFRVDDGYYLVNVGENGEITINNEYSETISIESLSQSDMKFMVDYIFFNIWNK